MTGASGYVGGRIKQRLLAEKWQVIELSRHAHEGANKIPFKLGDRVQPEQLEGYDALIHCAYDFTSSGKKDIHAVNVCGSEFLLNAAHQAGVQHLSFISTMGAFEGCRSLYGKGKLEVEAIALSLGASVIRPGLVYGGRPGGMFGRLVRIVRRLSILPIPKRSRDTFYMVHEADLAEAVVQSIHVPVISRQVPISVAHEEPWTLQSLLQSVARGLDKKVSLVPVPWQLMWAALRTLETFNLPVGFSSDNLISIAYQDPKPNLNAWEALGVRCRPFQSAAALAPFAPTPPE
jgi:nucleoside-diphosphate-sugar epimerase